ncbi:DinB family protein [Pontibacter liquoris]|uniref:DinB family protein n=1 Tax=Pontibacter liquoris TaxID=2905677 RepID=UPI001FA7C5D7|nr:DinB family protein [Pontibacter liquoris]
MSFAVYTHNPPMNPALEARYLHLEQTRNRLLDELEGLEEGLLNSAPAEGKWSVNQIIAHLLLTEKQTVYAVQHKVSQPDDLISNSIAREMQSLLLKLALLSGKKFKAPASVATVPATCSLAYLRADWDEVRFSLEDVLTALPVNLMDKCLFRHPYVGPLTIRQTLSFLQDHFDHHLRQIHTIKRALLA